MGFIHVPVTVRNPADDSKEIEVNFLVDTGALDSLVPRDQLEAIGITPKGQREYVMADGSEATFDVATADMEIMGELVASRIVFGEPGTQPLLGAIDLQAAAIVVNPSNETLPKMPSLRRL
ncbi:MAG: clan AA aspartic protease [Chloroflexi bacterium]|nr:clan AA aspartic protease [Chloroflexota bacterium]